MTGLSPRPLVGPDMRLARPAIPAASAGDFRQHDRTVKTIRSRLAAERSAFYGPAFPGRAIFGAKTLPWGASTTRIDEAVQSVDGRKNTGQQP